jgi:hypothetical protein
MGERFSWGNLFTEFQSREIDAEELESIIKDTVEREHPDDSVVDIKYTDEGIDVVLESGDEIGIEVDWNEIILS